MITAPPIDQTAIQYIEKGARAVFLRENDHEPLAATIQPHPTNPDRWTYSVALQNGRELCHGELRLELHKTLDSVIKAVVEAFKGSRTTPTKHHHGQ